MAASSDIWDVETFNVKSMTAAASPKSLTPEGTKGITNAKFLWHFCPDLCVVLERLTNREMFKGESGHAAWLTKRRGVAGIRALANTISSP